MLHVGHSEPTLSEEWIGTWLGIGCYFSICFLRSIPPSVTSRTSMENKSTHVRFAGYGCSIISTKLYMPRFRSRSRNRNTRRSHKHCVVKDSNLTIRSSRRVSILTGNLADFLIVNNIRSTDCNRSCNPMRELYGGLIRTVLRYSDVRSCGCTLNQREIVGSSPPFDRDYIECPSIPWSHRVNIVPITHGKRGWKSINMLCIPEGINMPWLGYIE
jgi:hypothetical protein